MPTPHQPLSFEQFQVLCQFVPQMFVAMRIGAEQLDFRWGPSIRSISIVASGPRKSGKIYSTQNERGSVSVQIKPKLFGIVLALTAAFPLAAAETDLHIPFEKYKLQNGMRVVLSRDTAVPVIAVYVIYDVGRARKRKAAPASRICSST